MKKKALLFLLIFIFLFSTTGCTKNNIIKINKTKKETVKKEKTVKKESINLVGSYELIEIKVDTISYTEEDLKTLKTYGMTVTLELKEDKTGSMNLFGQLNNLKYDEEYVYSEEEKLKISMKKDILELSKDEAYMKFKKINKN